MSALSANWAQLNGVFTGTREKSQTRPKGKERMQRKKGDVYKSKVVASSLQMKKTYHNLVFKIHYRSKNVMRREHLSHSDLYNCERESTVKPCFHCMVHLDTTRFWYQGFSFNSFSNATGTPSLGVGLSQQCNIQIAGAEMFLKKLTSLKMPQHTNPFIHLKNKPWYSSGEKLQDAPSDQSVLCSVLAPYQGKYQVLSTNFWQ